LAKEQSLKFPIEEQAFAVSVMYKITTNVMQLAKCILHHAGFMQDFEYMDFTVQYLTIELGKLLPRENL